MEGKVASLCCTNVLDLGQSPSKRNEPQPKACVSKRIAIFGTETPVTKETSSPVLAPSTGPASLAGLALCDLTALGNEQNRLVVPPHQPAVWGQRAGSTSLVA